VGLTAHPHLAPTLKKEYNCSSTPSPCLHVTLQGELYLFIYSKRKQKRRSTREKTCQHRRRRIQRGVACTITPRLTEIRHYVNFCRPVQTLKSCRNVFCIPQEINKLYRILFRNDTWLNFFIVHFEAHFVCYPAREIQS